MLIDLKMYVLHALSWLQGPAGKMTLRRLRIYTDARPRTAKSREIHLRVALVASSNRAQEQEPVYCKSVKRMSPNGFQPPRLNRGAEEKT